MTSGLVVTSPADPVALTPGTLRYAIQQADTDAGNGISDTITFDTAKMGTNAVLLNQGVLTLISANPSPTATITIDGGGVIAIDGNHQSSVFDIDSTVGAILTGLTIKNGNAVQGGIPAFGGGVINAGNLQVFQCTFLKNVAGAGGAIDNVAGGVLTVINSTFTNNSATGSSTAPGSGFGGAISSSGSFQVTTSTFFGNTAKNAGGAIDNENTSPAFNQTVFDSTFNANSVTDTFGTGGAIENGGGLELVYCTIAGNSATGSSGEGGGIANFSQLTMFNTLVAQNTVPSTGTGPDINGPVTSASSNNLIGNGSGMSGLSNGVLSNQIGPSPAVKPNLGPLANNGGPTQTMALLPGSSAIGHGTLAVGPTLDQRGVLRPNPPDIGAYQTTSPLTITTPSLPAGAAGKFYSATISSSGGSGRSRNYSYSLASGSLPGGLTLSSSGVVSGTTTSAGSFSFTVQVADAILASTATRTYSLIVNPAAAASFSISAPSRVTAGVGFGITITALDSFGNTATGYSGTATLTATDGRATLPAQITLSNGTGTFSVTLQTAGTQALRATDTVSSSITGTSNAIGVRALIVTSFTPTPTGFTVTFSQPVINSASDPVHIYDAASASYGAADVVLFDNTANSIVRGSVIMNAANTGFTFIKTGGGVTASGVYSDGLLAADSYTVTLRSSAAGFRNLSGVQLDGNNSGVPGTNYTTSFTVAANTAVIVTIPDFARGPDATDPINVPSNAATPLGIPIALSNGSGVTSGSFLLSYDADYLTITGGTVNPGLANATFTVTTSGSGASALANITFSSPTPLAAGAVQLGGLTATVPANAPYKAKQLLHFTSLSLNGGNIAATNDDGVHAVAFLGDVSGDGNYTNFDSTLVSRVAAHADSGFAAYAVLDPVIVGDINGDGNITSGDGVLLNRYLNGTVEAQIPNYPGAPSNVPAGPDPTLTLPTNLAATAGGQITVPVNIDDPHPAGSTGLMQAQLALTFDPAVFTVSPGDIHLGSVPASGTGWVLQTRIDDATGQLGITLFSGLPITSTTGGSLVTIDFQVKADAPAGASAVHLVSAVNPNGLGVIRTGLADALGPLTLHTTPGVSGTPGGDGLVVVTQASAGPRRFAAMDGVIDERVIDQLFQVADLPFLGRRLVEPADWLLGGDWL